MNLRHFVLCGLCIVASAKAGLIAQWKLDNSTADLTGDYPATWSSSATYTSAVAAPMSAAAVTLNGSNWLKAGTGIDLERGQTFSACAWIKGGQQDSTIIGDMEQGEDYRGWELHVGTTSNGGSSTGITVWLINDYPAIALQVNAAVNVLNNTWHHVAFTYDGSSSAAGVKIYVDGVAATTTTGLNTLTNTIANHAVAELNIGTRMNGAYHNFTGSIDEAAIFDNVLTAAQVNSIYVGGVEPVAYAVVSSTVPASDQSVLSLSEALVTFSLPVNGVDAGDLLVNGVAAISVEATGSKTHRFTFPSPPLGDVVFSWAAGHGIMSQQNIAAQPAGWTAHVVTTLPPTKIAIAEFLTKNAGGQYDEDYDTPDWIELYNYGTTSVNLGGWRLTDDATKSGWTLPSFTLAPNARRLVFASGKDRTNPAGTLHSDFKLGIDGGYLGLKDPGGTIIHEFNYPKQEGNVSFGLLATGTPADGRAGWRYLNPSPGAAQAGTAYSAAEITDMQWTPATPQVGDAITITIRVSPTAVLTASPNLIYRQMFNAETTQPFFNDGLHGDGAANDEVWGSIIPAGATAGKMMRWRASLSSNGAISRWPINTNTANPLPLYEGTVVGGTPVDSLTIYQVFVDGYVFPTSTSQTGVDSTSGGHGAIYAYGKLYDNLLIRVKGTTSAGLMKRSHRFDFNPGRDFAWSSQYPAQRELNMNSEYNDPSYLRQNLQLWLHRTTGNAGSLHFPVKMLMNGSPWQLAFHSYSADDELMETMGLDPRGAVYKQVGTLETNSGGEKKTRRWENTADFTALKSGIYSQASAASKSLYVHDNFNLPAVINYLAVTRLTQEGDDVWANMVIYRDSENTNEWRPIPFDLNLSFGQLFYGFSAPYNTTIEATNDANKSHPLYGSASCLPNTGSTSSWNRMYDAIIQNSVTRSMLLRRMRTLMDRYLATTAAASPLETLFDSQGALINAEATADRSRWGWPPNALAYGLGPNISPTQGLNTLKTSFLAARRTHLFTTHSINNSAKTTGLGNNNKAGIPDPQSATPTVSFGTIVAHPTGSQDQEYVQINNPNSTGLDISDWTLRGSGGSFKMKGGTVIAANGSIYISPNVFAFRARTSSPKGNENRFVVGPYSGHLSPFGETLRLENENGTLMAQAQVAADPNAPAIHLAITEILSNSSHTDNDINGDWWELTNTGTNAVELTGFSWDDNRFLAGQAVFPVMSIAAGETMIILDEDDATETAQFRTAWHLDPQVRVLTREDFNLPGGFRGLGNGDSVAVYYPDGTQVARVDYPTHVAGKSRAWFKNGIAVPGGYSEVGKYAAIASTKSPADVASPGFAAADPSTFTAAYDIWAAANDLWSTEADPAADVDGDGRSNRSEYVFGGSPRIKDSGPAQTIVRTGGTMEWTMTRRSNDAGVVVVTESSTDMATWSPMSLSVVRDVPHPTISGYTLTTYSVPFGPAKQFLRARSN